MFRPARSLAAMSILALAGCPRTALEELPSRSASPAQLSVPDPQDRFSPPISWSRVPVPPKPDRLDDLFDLGDRLYGWNCFPCHGASGRGDGPVALRQGLLPRDLTRGMFKLKTSLPGEPPLDEDLYRTISTGISSGGMPRNSGLEPRDRWALVAFLHSITKPDAQRSPQYWKAPPVPDRLDARRGKELFTRTMGCVQCHGPAGKGDGPAAAGLRDAWDRPAPPPDLSRGELNLKAGSGLEDIFRVLTLGMAGTPMPSFGALSERDRWDLAAFVRSLFEPISPGERIFLGAGCTACHTIGRGKLVGPDLMDVGARHDRGWLRQWLADPPGMLARDPGTRERFKDYAIQMPNPDLTEGEIESVAGYLESLRSPVPKK